MEITDINIELLYNRFKDDSEEDYGVRDVNKENFLNFISIDNVYDTIIIGNGNIWMYEYDSVNYELLNVGGGGL